ncbi:MAG: ABC transporter ATP-binding protein [Oscillospiraceae bacterium]
MKLLKKFVKYYKPYRVVFFADLFCALLVSAIDLVFPWLLRYLAANLFGGSPDSIMSQMMRLFLALLFLYLIQTVCRYFVTYQGHMLGARMESTMREELFDQYERLSFSYYDRHNTGKLMSRLISDLFDITEMAHHGPENLFISFIKIAGSLALLFSINVQLTLVLLAIIVVMAVFSFYKYRKMSAIFRENREKISDINARLQDSLSGIRVVKSFGNEELEKEKFSVGNQAFLVSQKKKYRCMADYSSTNLFLERMLYTALLVGGGIFIAKGSLAASDLSIYALYINVLIGPIDVLIELTEMLQRGMSAFSRFEEIMETVPEIQDSPDAEELSDVKGVIDYRDVSFSYDEGSSVLSHINIHVDAGKSVALVGPSGGGKTTLCSLLPRFYDVTSGSVMIDGRDVRGLTQKSLRKAIGLVQQDVYLFDGTVMENILYGRPDAGRDEVIEAARAADIHDFIMSLPDGYDTRVGERGTRLSGGQKQRIAIARVFLKNPPVLILDEATSSLDNESELHIQKSLDRLAKGRTTITIAHRLSTIRNADEIIVIDENGIAERGTHEELIAKNGIYKKYYDMQFDRG